MPSIQDPRQFELMSILDLNSSQAVRDVGGLGYAVS